MSYDFPRIGLPSASQGAERQTRAPASGGWKPRHSRDSCNACNDKFSLLNRRRHCRNCGLTFCHKCCSYRIKLPGHSDKSKVCASCFPKVFAASRPPINSFIHSRAWVPRGIFTHMLGYLDHRDLIRVSMACRWWYARSSLDIVWHKLYDIQFADDEEEKKNEMASFHREVHGDDYESLPWKKKYAVRWASKRANEKKQNFEGMRALLASLGLSKYADIFEAEEIDVESLCLMNAGHLRSLGIPTGPQLKLLNAAACLANLELDDHEKQALDASVETKSTTQAGKYQQQKTNSKQHKATLVRRVQQSIVRIAVLTSEGCLCNVASGSIIHERGLIMTARHCLVGESFDCTSDPSYLVLVAPTESTSQPPCWKYRAEVLPEYQDEELDFALLWLKCEVVSDPPCGLYLGDVTERTIARNWSITEIAGTNFDTMERLPAIPVGNSNNLELGDEMWMFGYPSSGHNTITVHHAMCSGTDSMVYRGREVGKAWLRAAAQLDNGFSGGAAVDSKGHLVGLISFSVLRQDRVRAVNMLKGFIEKAKVERLGTCSPTIPAPPVRTLPAAPMALKPPAKP